MRDVYGLLSIVLRLFREPLTHRDGIIKGLGSPKRKDRCSLPTSFEQDSTTAAVIQGLGFWGLTRTTAQSCLFLQKTIMVSKDLFLPGSPRTVCCIKYSFFFSDGSKLTTNCISFVLKFAFDLLLLNYHNCFILHFHFKYDN